MSKDFYTLLGVDRSASKDDIKKAYRKMSKELHPDKHKGDKEVEKKFQEINEAYEVLSDDKKRQMYDQFGSTGGPGGGGGTGGFDFSGFQQGDFGGFSDIFETFFNQGRGGGAPRKEQGRDIEIELTIDFQDVVKGATKTVSLTRLLGCKTCSGTGAKPGTDVKNCSTCHGTGQITKTVQSFLGTVQQSMVCNVCRGAGQVPETPCADCHGEGRQSRKEDVVIEVPAGIHEGQTLRLQQEGEVGRGGTSAGNLYVHIRIRNDANFMRDGDDIQSQIRISVLDAILGTEAEVKTVHGTVTLKIPEGTQPQQVFRLKGKGLPVLNSSRHGDHYVTVKIEVPKKLSKAERKLLEEWRTL